MVSRADRPGPSIPRDPCCGVVSGISQTVRRINLEFDAGRVLQRGLCLVFRSFVLREGNERGREVKTVVGWEARTSEND